MSPFESYVAVVTTCPMTTAAVQFGLLGTAGEYGSAKLRSGRWSLDCSWGQLAGKVAAWALLGIVIKYGFIGMKGCVAALFDHGLLPAALAAGVGRAFVVSVVTNLFFGPQMMYFHRFEENVIMGKPGDYRGLDVALRSLIWFWIPAHTVTFSLPKDFQIGLAACWSVVLGLILGLAARHPAAKSA